MSSVATAMLVDLFGEAGGFELAVLTSGPYWESCLEESRGWAAAAGWYRICTGCRVPLPLVMMMASAALYAPRSSILGYPYRGTRQECVVGAQSLGSARQQLL